MLLSGAEERIDIAGCGMTDDALGVGPLDSARSDTESRLSRGKAAPGPTDAVLLLSRLFAVRASKKMTCFSINVVFSNVSIRRVPIPSGHSVLLTPLSLTPIFLIFVGLLRLTVMTARMTAGGLVTSICASSGSMRSKVSPFA